MRATINDKEIFLDAKQLPAITLSINSITDPDQIAGAMTTTIKALATREIKQVLGTEFMAQVDRPSRPVLRIGSGGVDDFRSNIIVRSRNRDVYELLGASGNATWFEYAKRTNLRDFDFGQSYAPLGNDYVSSTWTDEDQLLYFPLMDFGGFEGRADTYMVQRWRMRPGMRVHRLIDTVLEPTGLRMVPKGSLARIWKKFVVVDPAETPLTEHFYGNPQGATVQPAGSAAYSLTDLGTTPDAYPLTTVVFDPASHVTGAIYDAPFTNTIDVRVDGVGLLPDPFDLPADGDIFYLHVYDFTDDVPLATSYKEFQAAVDPNGVRWWTTFNNVEVIAGHDIGIAIQRSVGGYSGTTDINAEAIVSYSPFDPFFTPSYFKFDDEDFSTFLLNGIEMPIQQETAAPDMTLMDLVKAIANNQCLAFNTVQDSGIIEVWYEREYMRSPVPGLASRDWSARVDHTSAPNKIFDEMPRRLRFRWQEDSGDKELMRAVALSDYPHYGNADFDLPDAYGKEKTVQMPFAASAMGEIFTDVVVPILRDINTAFQVDNYDRQPRLLIADGLAAGDWTFSAISQSLYPNCYFVTPDVDGYAIHFDNASAGYAGTVPTAWASRLVRMRDSRILDAELLLRDHEIQDFDHGMPTLVDDGSGPAWYYVQEIFQHQFGRNIPTKCLLVQVQSKEVALQFSDVTATYPEIPELADVGDFNNDFSNDFFNNG